MKIESTTRAAGLAFVTAAVTLFVQVLFHRMVSAKLLNNFAFLIISLTMLGFALSGVLLTRLLPRFIDRAGDALSACSAGFVLTSLGASVAFYRTAISMNASSRPDLVRGFMGMLPYALLFALPFLFCGLILGTLLSSPTLSSRRVYFFDLLGSAVGAFAVIPAIGRFGVETSLLLGCGLLLAGTLSLAPPRNRASRMLTAAAVVAWITCSISSSTAFSMRYPVGSMLWGVQKEGGESRIEAVVWDPIARIEVARIKPPDVSRFFFSCLIGPNTAFHQRFRRLLTQNNYAFTYAVEWDGRKQSLAGIDETIYSAAYHATSVARPRVGILGVGGGFDVLNALFFDASQVTAVEVNAATVSILQNRYRDYFASWVRDPRVKLVLAEGRHFLSTHDQRYDILQLSGVDSYSGTPAAAHVFSENYLYTAEAFDLYLSRLTEEGILNVMRLEQPQPREMLRALVTAIGALRRGGVGNPSAHIVTLTARPTPNFTAMLVKRTPFTPDQVRRIARWAASNPYFEVTAAPGIESPPNLYQAFLNLGDPSRERAFVFVYPWNIAAVTDDQPFFFRFSYWWHLFPADPLVWASLPFMELSTVLLVIVIGLASLACVYVPLRYLSHRAGGDPGTRRFGVFFSAIGLGYMAVEIALLQKYGLFLGHPNYALSVVLAALLCSTGIGALISAHIVRAFREFRFVGYVLSCLILAEYLLVFPRLHSSIGLSFPVRILVVTVLVMPIGLCLGVFFPSGLERLKTVAPDYAPWAWGLNGIFSVLGPVLAVAVSMSWGINALLLAAIPFYLAAAMLLPADVSRSASSGNRDALR